VADLSPAAQAVLDAVEDDCIHPTDRHRIAAAAIRAAADRLDHPTSAHTLYVFATELEAGPRRQDSRYLFGVSAKDQKPPPRLA
jgi:hypothetical protein